MSPSTPPIIRNPLRILVITTSPSTPVPCLLEGKTIYPFHVPPSVFDDSEFTKPGLTGSELPLTTPYYSTTVPLWHDTIPADVAALENWQDEWSAPEAGEDDIRNTLTAIHKIITHHQEETSLDTYTPSDNEPLLLIIGMPQPLRPLLEMSNDGWEDLGLDCGGWQWIDSEAKGKNQFGEKLGLERLQEALEANVWDGGGGGDPEVDAAGLEDALGVREHEHALDDLELERDDLVGLREAILGAHDASEEEEEEEDAEDDAQVQELESMMLKMQAIKGLFSRPITNPTPK
ncbi:MAG: hypothetical protein Q9169_002594 [Polycauliona sp. 2 TL-2023]